ncbi:MAG: hypothetical protein KBT31_07075 [Firmicutes bacterium]|nr:hypothetical protein [Candidatus Colimorpha enterica]
MPFLNIGTVIAAAQISTAHAAAITTESLTLLRLLFRTAVSAFSIRSSSMLLMAL